MRKKLLWATILLFTVWSPVKPQNDKQAEINKFDKDGLKTGFWVDKGKYNIEEIYYNKGLKQGVCKLYNKRTGKLEYFGEYNRNTKFGTTWYTFDEDGYFLLWTENNITKNTQRAKNGDGSYGGVFDYRSNVVMFYPNGEIEEEGTWLYDDFQSDESESIGLHLFFDFDGNKISTSNTWGFVRRSDGLKIHFYSKNNKLIEKSPNEFINQTDKNGLRYGLWKDDRKGILSYYKNGKLNGVYRVFSKTTGKLSCFGEYANGFRTGNWFYFNEKSQLVMIEKNISVNTDKIKKDDGKEIVPKFKSYVIIYYTNGFVREEGTALYDEDIEMDFFKTGIWKYYDKKGIILKQTKEQ